MAATLIQRQRVTAPTVLLVAILSGVLLGCPQSGQGPRQVFDSSPAPQLVGEYHHPAWVVLTEGGVEFALGVGADALHGVNWPLFFDDDSCGGGGGQAWVQELVAHRNLIVSGYLKGSDVYVPALGASAPFSPKSQRENDGSCTDLVPDPPAGTGFPATVIKNVSGFVPPFVLN